MIRPIEGAARVCALALLCGAAPGRQDAAAPAAPKPRDAQDVQAPGDAQLAGSEARLELTLKRALELALEHNLGFQIEALAAEAAKFEARASWGTFDWTLGARAGWADAKIATGDTSSGDNSNIQDFSVDLTRPFSTGGTLRMSFDTVNRKTNATFQQSGTADVLSVGYLQPLLRGAWREYATADQRAAELEYERLDERERQVRQTLIRDIADAYWELVASGDELEVARLNVALGTQQVDQNQRRADAGIGTEVEVLQAQTEVATREETRLLAEVHLRQSDDALKRLLFSEKDPRTWETTLVPITPLPEIASEDEIPEWRNVLAKAIDNRAELRQQRYLIDEFTVRHQAARSDRRPQLDVDLAASSQSFSGDSGEAFDGAVNFDFPTYRAALIFSFPLENTTARGLERAAWSRLRAEKLRYNDLESQIASEAREAVRQVAYQAEAVRAAQKSKQLAERQLAAEQARYAAQLSTNFQVLQFQQDLARARASEVRARARHAKALVALRAAQGLLDAPPAP